MRLPHSSLRLSLLVALALPIASLSIARTGAIAQPAVLRRWRMMPEVKSLGLAVALLISIGVMPDRALDVVGGRVAAQESKSKSPPMGALCNLPPKFTLAGHLSPVTAMGVSADNKTLVSGDQNGVVNVWSLETGQLLHSLAAYPGEIQLIAITPDGKSIVSLVREDNKGVVKIWSLETGQLIRSFETGFTGTSALSPDGKSIVNTSWIEGNIAIEVWNLQTGQLIQSLTKQRGIIQTLDSLESQTIIRLSEVGEEYSYEIKIEFLNRSNGSVVQSSAPATSGSLGMSIAI